MSDGKSEQAPKIDVLTYDPGIDYVAEKARLQGALRQLLYGVRLKSVVADAPEVAVIKTIQRHGVDYRLLSRGVDHLRITNDEDGYTFEADFSGVSPLVREYITRGDELTEITPGEDEAGCQSLATAAQLLVWASMSVTAPRQDER